MSIFNRIFGKKKNPSEEGSIPATTTVTSRARPDKTIGFFDGLSKEQQEAALSYEGEENLGDHTFARKRRLVSREPLPEPRPRGRRYFKPQPLPAIEWQPPSREDAEAIQRERDRKRNEPVALKGLWEYPERGAKTLFETLQQEYIECLLSGRLDQWSATAHSIVDLLASPQVKVQKRAA